MKNERLQRVIRHRRVRKKISGTPKLPRLNVFRSNKHIYAQLIDDQSGTTLISSADLNLSVLHKKSKERMQRLNTAFEIGKILAQKAIKKNIKKIIFDRSGYNYHGRVKAFAEGARVGGLNF